MSGLNQFPAKEPSLWGPKVRIFPPPRIDVIKSMAAEKAVNSQMLIIDRDRKLLRMRMYLEDWASGLSQRS